MKTSADVQDHRWVPREHRHSGKGIRSGQFVLQLHRKPDLQSDRGWRWSTWPWWLAMAGKIWKIISTMLVKNLGLLTYSCVGLHRDDHANDNLQWKHVPTIQFQLQWQFRRMPWELGGSAEAELGYYWIRWICKWCFRVSVCTYESSGETIAGIYQALHVVLHCTLCCRKLIRCSRDLGATLFSPMECEIHGVEAGGSIWHFLCCLTITLW